MVLENSNPSLHEIKTGRPWAWLLRGRPSLCMHQAASPGTLPLHYLSIRSIGRAGISGCTLSAGWSPFTFTNKFFAALGRRTLGNVCDPAQRVSVIRTAAAAEIKSWCCSAPPTSSFRDFFLAGFKNLGERWTGPCGARHGYNKSSGVTAWLLLILKTRARSNQ